MAIDQCLKHGKLLFQFGDRLSPLNSRSPVAVLLAASFAQVLILEVRVLAAELVIDVLAFRCRADPDIGGSHTARVADCLDELKKAISLSL